MIAKPSSYLLLFLSVIILLAITPTTNAAAGDPLPETVVKERLDEAPQVLLIQTTDGGIASSVLKDSCGNQDTYYTTSALVLGVNRTVDPDSTALGVAKGKVVSICDQLQFVTVQKEWTYTDNCEELADPGRKEEGWCGYIYLLEGSQGIDGPFALGTGGPRSFVEVDEKVCEEAKITYCPDGGAANVDDGGVGGDDSANSGVGGLTLGVSFLAAFLSSTALWNLAQ